MKHKPVKASTVKHLRRQVVHLDESQIAELQRVREEVGIPVAVQVRRAVDAWLRESTWLRTERR